MARSKLKSALENEKGRNIKLEKQRKKEKEARKRKQKQKNAPGVNEDGAHEEDDEDEEDDAGGVSLIEESEVKLNGKPKGKPTKKNGILKKVPEEPEWETDMSDDDGDSNAHPGLDLSALLEDSDSEGSSDDDAPATDLEKDSDDEVDEDEEDDIPLSDIESLASEDKGDIIPHQRLTINNTPALLAALNRISLPYSKLAFSEHQSVVTDEPVEIPDVEDDLNRELAFYKQSLSAVKEARQKLTKEGVKFSRPADYFAEMVKSDEHMGKIKQKLVDDAAGKKAAAEARRQRDLKKFGKQVQVAKIQERAKEKRDTLEKINLLKRKRQGADLPNTHEEDLFDVELDKTASNAPSKSKSPKTPRSGPGANSNPRRGGDRGDRDDRGGNPKRQKKDAKYGFGGKKRHAKSNDAFSSADPKGSSNRNVKGRPVGGGGGGAKVRLGKSRRAKRT
ncbi:eukaryotic rRNA processing protein EBP2-domain-containing protein [Clohesyomyces aquaticus]|uniref:Eukaryotic rRNA processing protein EBP2-domain-containing protein n=1 Tax=Clohesyomyces aquaticus TaxID=1231657 RepID=A0A1Y2AAC4_9PLEO|nr:eukaryotic rRNA processing protein EBP2-domain-containing protein [Clohesyomyces aquaticus]